MPIPRSSFILDGRWIVASLFAKTIQAILEGVLDVVESTTRPIQVRLIYCIQLRSHKNWLELTDCRGFRQTLLLVGSFGQSKWLLKQLTSVLQPMGITVFRPEGHLYVLLYLSVSDENLTFVAWPEIGRSATAPSCTTSVRPKGDNPITETKY